VVYYKEELDTAGTCHGSVLITMTEEGTDHVSLAPHTTIGTLPDNVLLDIFEKCIPRSLYAQGRSRAWYQLVHVCRRSRRWRYVVFASPLHLNLRLFCMQNTPVRKMLDIWPPLPQAIKVRSFGAKSPRDNIIAALEHPDRICRI
jgi:hypothetical protein